MANNRKWSDLSDEDNGNDKATTAATETPARAPATVDPDLIDDYFQQAEILEETLRQIEGHAKFGNAISELARGLLSIVRDRMTQTMPDGTRRIKKGLEMGEAKQAAGLLEQLAKAGDRGIDIYRKSRGIHERQRLEHSGRIDGTRVDDTITAHLGFALQGASGRPVSVSEDVPGGSQQAEDLDSEQADREKLPDCN